MKAKFVLSATVYSLIVGFLSNSFVLIRQYPKSLFALVPVFLITLLLAGASIVKTGRSKICFHGTVLLYAFCVSVLLGIPWHIFLGIQTIPGDYRTLVWSLVLWVGVLFVVFWVGILCVYLASSQLGTRLRIIGAVCGLIPVANLVALFFILKATTAECLSELGRDQRNKQRKSQRVCATRYPILLVHGVFFRDNRFFNYWGRIPK